MAYSVLIKIKARDLHRRGYSLKEISRSLGMVKSTVSIWAKDIKMNKAAETRLLTKIKLGQFNNAQNRRAETKALEEKYLAEALTEIKSDPNWEKIMCAMIYWCEGGKGTNGIAFTNSDPNLVRTFLGLLRKSFELDESKFRSCIHIHSYHSAEKQLDFWSKITDIDKRQFIKSYRKPNTRKRIRDNYQGCIFLRHYSNDLARRLMAIAKAFFYERGA